MGITTRARFIDISKWQSWAKMREAVATFDIDAIVIRLSNGLVPDPLFQIFAAQAKAQKLPIIVYHAFQPYYSPEAQIATMKKALGDVKPCAIVLDLEVSGGYSKAYLQTQVKALLTLMRANFGSIVSAPKLRNKVWIYSRRSWLFDYFGFPSWLCEYFAWSAQYPYVSEMYPADFIRFESPAQPYTWCSKFDAWQFTENMCSEGCFGSAHIDANVANFTVPEFLVLLGVTDNGTVPPPSPVLETPIAIYGVIAPDGINVRATPSVQGTIVGTRRPFEQLYVYELRNVSGTGTTPDLWGRVSPDSWVAIRWHNGSTFIELCQKRE